MTTALTISGVPPDQTTSGAIAPLSAVVISDPNGTLTETATVQLAESGWGTLSNPAAGSSTPATGTYVVSGAPSVVQAALAALSFVPSAAAFGNIAGIALTISDGLTSSSVITDVAVGTPAMAPTISGVAAVTTTDHESVTPFAAATIADPNGTANETAVVQLSTTADGALSDSAGVVNPATGTWSITGALAAVQAALQGLVFTPAVGQVALGNTIATGVALTLIDAVASTSASSSITAIADTAAAEAALAVLRGPAPVVVTAASGGVFPAALANVLDVAALDPVAGSSNTLPSGYEAEFLAGTASGTLTTSGTGATGTGATGTGATGTGATGTGAALLVADAGSDVLIAGSGSTTLIGGSGSDTLIGAGTGDLLASSAAATLITGPGSNTISAGAGAQSINAAAGTSMIFLGAGPAFVAAGSADTIIGGAASATIAATSGSVAAFGGSGAMTFVAGGAASTVVGGSGPSTVFGGTGAGLVFAGAGNITLVGGSAAGAFVGGTGLALVYGDGGDGTIFGGSGSGVYIAGAAGTQIVVGTGASTIFAGNGSLVYLDGKASSAVIAGAGAALIIATASTGQDLYYLGAGSDTVVGGGDNDTIIGGSGVALLTGGSAGNLYAFIDGEAGGTDTITNFVIGRDVLALYGYGSHAITSSAIAQGSTTLGLADGTRIIFQGVTDLPYGPS